MHATQLAALMQRPPVFDTNAQKFGLENIGIKKGPKGAYIPGVVCEHMLNLIFGPMGWDVVDADTGGAPQFDDMSGDGGAASSSRVAVVMRTRCPDTKETIWHVAFGSGGGDQHKDNGESGANADKSAIRRAVKHALYKYPVFGKLAIEMHQFGYQKNNADALLGGQGCTAPGQRWAEMQWPDPSVWWRPGPGEGALTAAGQCPELFGHPKRTQKVTPQPYDQPVIDLPVRAPVAPVQPAPPAAAPVRQPEPVAAPEPASTDVQSGWGGPPAKTIDQEIADLMTTARAAVFAAANKLNVPPLPQMNAKQKRDLVDCVNNAAESIGVAVTAENQHKIVDAIKAGAQ